MSDTERSSAATVAEAEEHGAEPGLIAQEAEDGGDFRGKVATSVRWGALDQVVQQVLRVTITILLTRLTSPGDIGLISMAFVVTQLASLLTDLGMGPALVHRRDLTREHVATAFTGSAIFGAFLAGCVALAANPIASFFEEPRLGPVLMVMSLIFAFRGIQGCAEDMMKRDLMFQALPISSGLSVGLGGILGVTVAVLGHGVWGLVAYSVGEAVIAMFVTCFLAWRYGVWRPEIGIHRQALRDLLSFGASVSGFKILYYSQTNLDNLLVGKVLGSRALGLYNLAYRTMLYPILKVADVIGDVAFPAFSAIQQDPKRQAAGFRQGVETISLICFPFSIGILVTAPVLIPLVFGDDYVPAVLTVQILAANGPRLALNRLNGAIFRATGRPSWDLWLALASNVLYAIGFAIGVQYGISQVAIAFTVAGFVMFPVSLTCVSRAIDSNPVSLLRGVAPIAVATALMALAAVGARMLVEGSGNLVQLATMTLAGGAVYVAVVWRLKAALITRAVKDLIRR